MKICQHPPSEVTADILQGDVKGYEIKWCRLCGAVRVRHYDPDYLPGGRRDYTSPWIEPEDNKDVDGLDSRYPVVVYFGNDKDRDEFIAAVQEAKPNLTARSL